MKRIAFISMMLLSFTIGLSAAGKDKPVVVVTDIESSDISKSGLIILSEIIRQETVKSGKYTLMDLGQVNNIVERKKLPMYKINEKAAAREIGMVLGADKIISGRIGILGNLYIINIWIFDVKSGQIERHETEEFVGAIQEMRDPVKLVCQRLLAIEGIELERNTVLHVSSKPDGSRVYINGFFEGNTPLSITLKKAEKYVVKVWTPGYESWRQNVDVKSGKTTIVEAKLLKLDQSIADSKNINIDQDGRPLFITYMTLYSLFLAEGSLFTLGVDGSRPYIGLALIIPPVSFFTSLMATKNTYMSAGRSSMIISSSAWGTLWGISLIETLPKSGDNQKRAVMGMTVLGGSLTTAGAILFTADEKISTARASLINGGALLGSMFGLGIPYLINVQDKRVYFGTLIGGGIAGGLSSIYLTRNFDKVSESGLAYQRANSFITDIEGDVNFNLPTNAIMNMASMYLYSRTAAKDGKGTMGEADMMSYKIPLYTSFF